MMDAMAGVVVVHFGDPESTLHCLASISEDPSEVERRIAVVDNSGDFDPLRCDPDVTVISCPDNPGYGAGANAGLAEIDRGRECTLYVVLNNDTVICPGFLTAAAQALEVGVGAAGGPVRDATDPSRLWYTGGGINFATGTVWQGRSEAASKRRRDVSFIPATAMAVLPAAWREVGGFDPRFFLYNEDVDLCLRLRRIGWRLLFEPSMVCDHRLGGATGSNDRSPLYLENLTRTRLLPFRPLPYRLYLAGLHTAYNPMRVLGLGLIYGIRCGPYVSAVVRGHLHALATVLR
jgi:GT2 family glycosyltransferase